MMALVLHSVSLMRFIGFFCVVFLAGCGNRGEFFEGGNDADGAASAEGGATNPDAGVFFADTSIPDAGPSGPVDYVYAHTPTVLYKVDPVAKTMTPVGPFSSNCAAEDVIDIAIDANANGYATTYGGFYKLDLVTGTCTLIKSGSYPNSLSFVPAGTLDPNVDALVGYNDSTYIRIDTTTGKVTTVGGLTGGYASSGDIVSVKNGGTFLTVTGNACFPDNCLLQIDPKTGDMVQNYGSINHGGVWGLAFWAGTAYGFDNMGELFSIAWQNNNLVTTNVPTTPGLHFWGAGSTTSAPPHDADGGGIPIN